MGASGWLRRFAMLMAVSFGAAVLAWVQLSAVAQAGPAARAAAFVDAAKLTPPATGPGAEIGRGSFGSSVAFAPGGGTALIGDPLDNGGVGAAWVFVYKNGGWVEQQKLTAPVPSCLIPRTCPALVDTEIGNGQFGNSVALGPGGNTALIGSLADNGGVGAAWVFVRRDGSWTATQKLLAPTSGRGAEIGAGNFGSSVALASGGSTALIGAAGDDNNIGAAWGFVLRHGTWIDQRKLTPPLSGPNREIPNAAFGSSVALSSSGATALIGGPSDDHSVGAAWSFNHFRNLWTLQDKLVPPTHGSGRELGPCKTIGGHGVCSGFGFGVAVAAFGGATGLISGPFDANNMGAVWAFARKPLGHHGPPRVRYKWVEQQKLTAPTSGPDRQIGTGTFGGFGGGMGLSANGTAAVLSDGADDSGRGAAWIFYFQPRFLKQPAHWQEAQKLTAPTSGSDTAIGKPAFGANATLSHKGATAVITGPGDNNGVGAVWMFALRQPPIQ